jgi:hypothetical protein
VIAILAAATALASDSGDIEGLSKAASACDRGAMSKAWKDEVARHSAFIVTAIAEQRAIADARIALAERRRKSRTMGPPESEAVLSVAATDIDDRQRALDDQRTLDRMRQDAVSYFRQQYLTECGGRSL